MDSMLVSTISFSLICFFMMHQIGGTHFSMLEQLKVKKMMKISAIKTIRTTDGDIYDCIDVYKQPSLDHPLLRNHTIQLKPSFALDGLDIHPYLGLKNGCPKGCVPIRRIRKEDVKRVQSHLKKHPTSINPNSLGKPGWHFATALTTKLEIAFTGGRANFDLWNPFVTNQQHSDAVVYVSNGMFDQHNAIYAGWSAFPDVYGDGLTRLYTQWTADNYQKTGCIDMQCRGFVQVNKDFPLGMSLHPLSSYGGPQYSIPFTIQQDQMSCNWWLITSYNVVVGYWPKELFTGLVGFADEVGWGGRVFSSDPNSSPPMGSGHLSEEGEQKASFVQQMQYTQRDQGSFQDIDTCQLLTEVDNPNCYDLKLSMDPIKKNSNMFYGGPGGGCGV